LALRYTSRVRRKEPPPKKRKARQPIPKLIPLGWQIRYLRLVQDVSQPRLAEVAKLDYKYLGLIERAKVDPGAGILISLAEALGVPVGTLFELLHIPVDQLPIPPRTRASRRPKPY
jgi:transcriptional regulator with XRE-family HTH domain